MTCGVGLENGDERSTDRFLDLFLMVFPGLGLTKAMPNSESPSSSAAVASEEAAAAAATAAEEPAPPSSKEEESAAVTAEAPPPPPSKVVAEPEEAASTDEKVPANGKPEESVENGGDSTEEPAANENER